MCRAHARLRGFTLIEIMVVLVILGVIASVAVIRAPTGNRQLAIEAARIAAAVDLLSQQAIIRGVPHALEIYGDKYALREFRYGEWIEKQLPGVAAVRSLPAALRLNLDPRTGPPGPENKIVMLPSGELTAVGFSLRDSGSGDAVHYAVNDFGRFERLQ